MKSLVGEKRNEYGNKIIQEFSKRLTIDLGKGYSTRNLYNMRLYYLKFRNKKILQAVSANLSWSHFIELLNIEDFNEISYYIKISIEQNLSYRQLDEKTKNREYQRLNISTNKK